MVSIHELVAIFGFLNLMIGGTVLLLPIFSIQGGWLWAILSNIIYGSFASFTFYLNIKHLGSCKTVSNSIAEHFKNNKTINVLYNSFQAFSCITICIPYFILLNLQLKGFINVTTIVQIVTFIMLFGLTIMLKLYSFGEKFTALGFLSITTYIIFLVWSHTTAPYGDQNIPIIGDNKIDLPASLLMAYSLHGLHQMIVETRVRPQRYKFIAMVTYGIGILIYIFICFGGFSIINRQPIQDNPETIMDYFPQDGWEKQLIELIYIVHMVTVIPQNLILAWIYLLGISQKYQHQSLTISQIAFYFISLGICLVIQVAQINIATVIQFNGSIVGVINVFVLPIIIHLKCKYFSKHDQNGYMISQKTDKQNGVTYQYYGQCNCYKSKQSKLKEIAEILLQICIVVVGILTTIYSLTKVFLSTEQKSIGILSDDNL